MGFFITTYFQRSVPPTPTAVIDSGAGKVIFVDGTYSLLAHATSDAGISNVDFYWQDGYIGGSYTDIGDGYYQLDWTPITANASFTGSIMARAYDTLGYTADGYSEVIGVAKGLIQPLDGETLYVGTEYYPTVDIDSPLGISIINIYLDAENIGEAIYDAGSQYFLTWTPIGYSGAYTLTAEITDQSANVYYTFSINITIVGA